MLTFSCFYKDLFGLVTPKKRSVNPHYNERDAMSSVFITELSGFLWKVSTRKTTTTNSKKFRGQAAGSFVTATFLKPPGYVYAAPYAVPCKVLVVVNHPLSPHSYPCGPVRLLITQIRSPSSSLDSSELQHSNS